MYNNDLTLDTTIFSLVSEKPTSSIRRVATQPLDNPVGVTISHEVAKNGKVSSVIYIDDEKTITTSDNVVSSMARVQLKITYNPDEGRSDLTTVIEKGVAVMQSFLSGTGNVTKLLNQEH